MYFSTSFITYSRFDYGSTYLTFIINFILVAKLLLWTEKNVNKHIQNWVFHVVKTNLPPFKTLEPIVVTASITRLSAEGFFDIIKACATWQV